MSVDFGEGSIGAMIKPNPNRIRITIRLNGDIVDHFTQLVRAGGGDN